MRLKNYNLIKNKQLRFVAAVFSFLIILSLVINQVAPNLRNQTRTANSSWDMGTAGDYTYDNTKIDVANSTASLKNSNVPGANWVANDGSGNSWQYRRPVTINNSSGGALTDYQVLLDEGLVGHWKMDELSGTSITDSSGNDNIGTATAAATVVDGKYSKARSIDGSATPISVANSSSLSFGNDFTVSFWTKNADTRSGANWYDGWRITKDINGVGTKDWGFAQNGGKVNFMTGTSSTDQNLVSNATINNNVWHQVTLTRVQSSGLKSIYIDSTLDNVAVHGTDSLTNSANIVMGDLLNGLLDEVRIYNRALSQNEITYLYQNNLSPMLNSVYSHTIEAGDDLRFVDSDGTTLLNYWIEKYSAAGQNTKIWIKIPSISAASTKIIYIYYGNTHSPPVVSSGVNTFAFFDDFEGSTVDTNKWVTHVGESVSGGLVTVDSSSNLYDGTSYDNIYASGYNVPITSITEFKQKSAATNLVNRFGITDGHTTFYDGATNYIGIQKFSDGNLYSDTKASGTKTQTSETTYDALMHIYKFVWDTNLAKYYSDATLLRTYTTNVPASSATLHPYIRDVSQTDWVRVRKYASTEPTITSTGVGSEVIFNSYAVTTLPGTNWISNESGNSWSYRKTITIDNTGGSIQTNYQVLVTADTTGGHFKNDCSDIRFANSGGVTNLPYWIESGCATSTTKIWVKVDSIAAPPTQTTIYMYYGNANAVAIASGSSTFELFDDFESYSVGTLPSNSIWGNKTGTWQVSATQKYGGANALYSTGAGGSDGMAWLNSTSTLTSAIIDVDVYVGTNPTRNGPCARNTVTPSNGVCFLSMGNASQQYLHSLVTWGTSSALSTPAGNWNNIRMKFTTTSISSQILNVSSTPTVWTYSGSSGSYIGLTAGNAVYYDNFRIRKYTSTEPTTSLAAESTTTTPPTLTANTTQGYTYANGFTETLGAGSAGTIKYQVSPDSGSNWYWWNGSAWASTTTGYLEANLASDINTHFADTSFNTVGGGGSKLFLWRAYFISDGTQQPILDGITFSYTWDTLAPPNPSTLLTAKSQKTGGSDLTQSSWNGAGSAYFTWAAPTDVANPGEQASGIAGYYLYFGTNQNATPSTTRGIANELGGTGIHSQTDTDFELGVDTTALTTNTTYYLRIQTIDVAGNLQATPTTLFTGFEYDGVAPDSPGYITVSPSYYSRENNYTFTWPVSGTGMATDTGGSGLLKYQYKVGPSGTWTDVPGDLNTNTITPATPAYQTGANYFYLRAVDNAGNVDATPAQTTFFYNNSSPTAPRTLRVNPTSSSDNSFSFSWTTPRVYSGSIQGYYYSINNLPTANNISFTTNSSLSADAYATQQGTNTFYILAKDEATNPTNLDYSGCANLSGNEDTDTCAKVEFTANTSAPGQPTGLSLVDGSNRDAKQYKVFLTWDEPTNKGTGFAGYAVYRSTDNQTFAKVGETSGTTYADVNLSSIPYYYYIKSKDNAGQYSAQSDVNPPSITPTGKYTQPPTLTTDPTVETRAFSSVISFETDREASSFAEYGTTTDKIGESKGGKTIGQLEYTKKHQVTVRGLEPETTYFYQAVWIDSDGNQGRSGTLEFTTSKRPKIEGVASSNPTLNSITISWVSTTISTSTISYGKTTSYSQSATDISNSQTTTHSINLTNLQDSSSYHYQITGTDTDGNLLASDDYTFSTLTKPIITNVSTQAVKDAPTTTLQFSFTTNVPGTTIVDYTKNGTTSKQTKSDAKLLTDHSIQVPDLDDQSTYQFKVRTVDEHGNTAESADINFNTPNDTRPPKVSDLKLEVRNVDLAGSQKSQIVASWMTDEMSTSQIEYDQGLTGETYKNSTSEDKSLTQNHTVIASGLDPNKIYHLRVASKDIAGNIGYSQETMIITGKVQKSAIDIILNALERSLGWLFGLSFSK